MPRLRTLERNREEVRQQYRDEAAKIADQKQHRQMWPTAGMNAALDNAAVRSEAEIFTIRRLRISNFLTAGVELAYPYQRGPESQGNQTAS